MMNDQNFKFLRFHFVEVQQICYTKLFLNFGGGVELSIKGFFEGVFRLR